jgi:glycosyltransferase involved in cell wall biosynthesis/peptidoglycan/xylan/chitin deacetylase (PgdA/CDA1 family)
MNRTTIIASILSGLLVLYYFVKPALPRRLRYWMRRIHARRKRASSLDWPIKPGTETPPVNWPGWPEGRRFAVVLTHDVESQAGLDRCRQLMDLEKRLGFKSSFNLIPEGEYKVADGLREELVKAGFEVGVHDYRHDGTLFRSKEDFLAQSDGINRYLAEWDAVGFRAGFMFHNLKWLRRLNAKYDSSTFDVDPFEPQPAGIQTIFPFWVEGSDGHEGYIELPYTLVQDSTLFLLLREQTIAIWKRKLDWVAKHGGMVLLNVHPDYMDFTGGQMKWDGYPARLYAELLEYIRTEYAGQYWQPLPREVANFCMQFKPVAPPHVAETPSGQVLHNGPASAATTAPDLSGQRVCSVVFSYYPSDPRPRRAAEALVQQGMEVDVICLKVADDGPSRAVLNGVNIRHLPFRHRRGGKFNYIYQYAAFICTTFVLLAFRSLTRRYQLIHIHNMPDVLVFSALVPKLLGAKVILDLHDPMPELMTTIFGFSAESRPVRLLKRFEKWSTAFADAVITVNRACEKIFTSRSCRADKLHVVMNAPDDRIFSAREAVAPAWGQAGDSRPFVLMYHGSIVERHGLDLAVDAVEKVRPHIPNIELRVYGRMTPFLQQVMEQVDKRGLQDAVRYRGEIPIEKVVTAIDESDLGIISNRRSIFTEINTPTRIFEYLSRGKALIAPRAGGIQDYFSDDDLLLFNLGDADDLARQIRFARENPAAMHDIVKRGQAICRAHSWMEERQRFLNLTGRLLRRSVGVDAPHVAVELPETTSTKLSLIGVQARAEDARWVEEFFELFKTPWEFCRDGGQYDVVVNCGGSCSVMGARLTLVYGQSESGFDRQLGVKLQLSAAPVKLQVEGQLVPIYQGCASLEGNGVSRLKSDRGFTAACQLSLDGARVIRVGYDLFREVKHLLTHGQPAQHAMVPTLDWHVQLLRNWIVGSGVALVEIPPLPAGCDYAVCLTHDVDHPEIARHRFDHTAFGFWHRAVVGSIWRKLQGRLTWRGLFKNWWSAIKLPFVYLGLAPDFWRQFDRYLDLERGLGSTFFVVPVKHHPGKAVLRHHAARRATQYEAADIARDLKQVLAGGGEIGVHGIDAWADAEAGRVEASRVGSAVGETVRGVRMHWLCFDLDSPRQLEAAGYAYDSTVGYNECIGYKSGTLQVYRPAGAQELLELPLHVMDTALFYPTYLNLSPAAAAQRLNQCVGHAKRFGGVLTLNWHDRSLAPERLWGDFYAAFVARLRTESAWCPTAAQAVAWFKLRRAVGFEVLTDGSAVRLRVKPSTVGKFFPGLRVRFHQAPGTGGGPVGFTDVEVSSAQDGAVTVARPKAG